MVVPVTATIRATLHHDLRGIEPRFSGCIMGAALPLSYVPHGGATGLEPATFSLKLRASCP